MVEPIQKLGKDKTRLLSGRLKINQDERAPVWSSLREFFLSSFKVLLEFSLEVLLQFLESSLGVRLEFAWNFVQQCF